ncbi:hypothetical protein MEZE111188_20035 [Mesobacillus zeae]
MLFPPNGKISNTSFEVNKDFYEALSYKGEVTKDIFDFRIEVEKLKFQTVI